MEPNKLFSPCPPPELLREKSVFIAGCGGLGGYAALAAAKCGFGSITLCDHDVFTVTNLNRQLGCTEKTLGFSKVQVLSQLIKKVAPQCRVTEHFCKITSKNCLSLVAGSDIIIDGLDNIKTRLTLEKAAGELGLHIAHGAVEEYRLQVSLVPPGSGILSRLYSDRKIKNHSVLSFTPAFCAALQVNTAAAFLAGGTVPAYGRTAFVNLHSFTAEICDI